MMCLTMEKLNSKFKFKISSLEVALLLELENNFFIKYLLCNSSFDKSNNKGLITIKIIYIT